MSDDRELRDELERLQAEARRRTGRLQEAEATAARLENELVESPSHQRWENTVARTAEAISRLGAGPDRLPGPQRRREPGDDRALVLG